MEVNLEDNCGGQQPELHAPQIEEDQHFFWPPVEHSEYSSGRISDTCSDNDIEAPVALEIDELDQSADEWLDLVLGRNHHTVVVVEFSDHAAHGAVGESGEVVILMPAYSYHNGVPLLGCQAAEWHEKSEGRHCSSYGTVHDMHAGRLNPFAFVRVRAVMFSDGISLCSDCSNPGCERDLEVRNAFARHMRMPEQQHRSFEAALGTRSPLCRCAKAAIRVLCGSSPDAVLLHPEDGVDCPAWEWYQELVPFGVRLSTSFAILLCCLITWFCTQGSYFLLQKKFV
jgi:hypothetical protein